MEHSSCHVGTLGKSFTRKLPMVLQCETPTQCKLLWLEALLKGSVLYKERLRVVVDLKRRYRNSLNE